MWRWALPLGLVAGCSAPAVAPGGQPPDCSQTAAATPAPEARCVRAAGAFERLALPMMGTVVEVVAPADRAVDAAELVFQTFQEVDASMSEWREGSPLTAVNAAAGGEAVVVPPELMALLQTALDLGQLTSGAFDVSWAALWGLWDFAADAPTLPAAAEVARRAGLVDFSRVELDPVAGTVRLPVPGMKLGLGGIAKGHALDVAAQRLREAGITDFQMSAGGQVLASGRRGDAPWVVGIRDPRGEADDAFAELALEGPLAGASVSTSGDYERFFLVDGVRYHHLLDPRRGTPARGLRSATVISADATLADALSTAVFVMGAEAGLALIEQVEGVEAVTVDASGQVGVSSGLRDNLRLLRAPRP